MGELAKNRLRLFRDSESASELTTPGMCVAVICMSYVGRAHKICKHLRKCIIPGSLLVLDFRTSITDVLSDLKRMC